MSILASGMLGIVGLAIVAKDHREEIRAAAPAFTQRRRDARSVERHERRMRTLERVIEPPGLGRR